MLLHYTHQTFKNIQKSFLIFIIILVLLIYSLLFSYLIMNWMSMFPSKAVEEARKAATDSVKISDRLYKKYVKENLENATKQREDILKAVADSALSAKENSDLKKEIADLQIDAATQKEKNLMLENHNGILGRTINSLTTPAKPAKPVRPSSPQQKVTAVQNSSATISRSPSASGGSGAAGGKDLPVVARAVFVPGCRCGCGSGLKYKDCFISAGGCRDPVAVEVAVEAAAPARPSHIDMLNSSMKFCALKAAIVDSSSSDDDN